MSYREAFLFVFSFGQDPMRGVYCNLKSNGFKALSSSVMAIKGKVSRVSLCTEAESTHPYIVWMAGALAQIGAGFCSGVLVFIGVRCLGIERLPSNSSKQTKTHMGGGFVLKLCSLFFLCSARPSL